MSRLGTLDELQPSQFYLFSLPLCLVLKEINCLVGLKTDLFVIRLCDILFDTCKTPVVVPSKGIRCDGAVRYYLFFVSLIIFISIQLGSISMMSSEKCCNQSCTECRL